MRTDHIALGTQAEQFAFDRIAHMLRRYLFRKQFIERIAQAQARCEAIDGGFLASIGNPDVVNAGCAQFAAHRFRDASAGATVRDPELSDVGIHVGERVAVSGERVRKVSRVEVQSQTMLARPMNPASKVLRRDGITIDS